MKSKVYIETTIVSYLVASLTEDVIQTAHQLITRQWWERRDRFDLYVSRAVVAEARRGDPDAAARRLAALRGIPRLAGGPRVVGEPLFSVGRCQSRPKWTPRTSGSPLQTAWNTC